MALSAVMVPLVAVVITLSFRYGSHTHIRPWSVSLVVGLVVAVVVGGWIGVVVAVGERSRGVPLELRALSPEQRLAALRALRRGPAPADPAARAAAVNLMGRSLYQDRERRRVTVVCLGAAAVLALSAAALADTSVVGLLAAGMSLVALVLALLEPRRLRRRLAVLEG